MRKIVIQTIPHAEQRHDSPRDCWLNGDTLELRVSQLQDELYETALAVHALMESLLVLAHGVDMERVDEWKRGYAEFRSTSLVHLPEDAGDHPAAPYHHEHVFARNRERDFLHEAGGNWLDYERALAQL
jgi:hypothetical protein